MTEGDSHCPRCGMPEVCDDPDCPNGIVRGDLVPNEVQKEAEMLMGAMIAADDQVQAMSDTELSELLLSGVRRPMIEIHEAGRRLSQQRSAREIDFANDPMTMRLDYLLKQVGDEVLQAVVKFPPFASPHEGKAIIEEELDELWEEIKANQGRSPNAHVEAKQVAAMAVRYMLDLPMKTNG